MIRKLIRRFWWAPVWAFIIALAKEPLAIAAAATLAGFVLSYLERVLDRHPTAQSVCRFFAGLLPGALGHALPPASEGGVRVTVDAHKRNLALYDVLLSLTPEQRAGLTEEQRAALDRISSP